MIGTRLVTKRFLTGCMLILAMATVAAAQEKIKVPVGVGTKTVIL